MRKIGWRHTTECVTFPKGGYLSLTEFEQVLEHNEQLCELVQLPYFKRKNTYWLKTRIWEQTAKTRIHKRINTTIQDLPAIRVTKGDSWTEHVRGTVSSKFTNVTDLVWQSPYVHSGCPIVYFDAVTISEIAFIAHESKLFSCCPWFFEWHWKTESCCCCSSWSWTVYGFLSRYSGCESSSKGGISLCTIPHWLLGPTWAWRDRLFCAIWIWW
jgi:hypothetical protein